MPRGGRGHGRPRKGEGRMDAAVDAMKPYGYPEELVISTVRQLLEVYGIDGWPFIEEASYTVLLEALFEKEDKLTNENVKKDDLLGSENEGAANNKALAAGSNGTQGSASEAAKSPEIAKSEASVLNAEGEGSSCSKNRNANQDHEKNGMNNARVTEGGNCDAARNIMISNESHCLVEGKAFPMPSRGFYHGWYSDSSEPLELVQLKSSPLKFLAGKGILKHRKRRWDQMPQDIRSP